MKSDRKARVLKYLAEHQSGAWCVNIAIALDLHDRQAASLLSNMREDGTIVGVHDTAQRASRRFRWCLPQHEQLCIDAVRESVAKRKGEWHTEGLGMVPKSKGPAKLAPDAKVVDRKVKIIHCPSCKDTRYTVHHVNPVFGAMHPGEYMETGSAIERAYSA